MELDGIVAMRGLIDPAEVRRSLDTLKRGFSAANDRKRGRGEYHLVKTNYQRMLVGCTGGAPGYTNPRLYRTFYNPLWEDDIFGMHATFRQMARIRNQLSGLPDDYATEAEQDGLWSACRIQHYPRGGGFLIPHTDKAAHDAARRSGVERTVNLVLLMTKRGVDFADGGGYVVLKGEKVFFEEDYEVGDLVIYNEGLIHGVDDIDPLEPLDTHSPEGRYTGFVTLFAA